MAHRYDGCAECRRSNRERQAGYRERRQAECVLIAGRRIHPGEKHGGTGYCTLRCQCDVCTADWAATVEESRWSRKADSVIASDGRRYVFSAPHGTEGGYSNYGCRCPDCTDAHGARMRSDRERRMGRR